MYKLPDTILSWAKPVDEGPTETTEGLFLFNDDRPMLVHYSRLVGGHDIERSWLWLFSDLKELLALRLVTNYAKDPELMPIRNALLDEENKLYPQQVELGYLKNVGLKESGIDEIWVGFNWKHYAKNRDMPMACEAVLSTAEFLNVAAR